MIEKLKRHRLLFVVTLISAGLFFFYLTIQPPLTYSFSDLFDGSKYLKAYAYFNIQSDIYDIIYPINTRILVPWMAANLPFDDPVDNFLSINFLFLLLSIISIYVLWRQLNISSGHMMTGFFWLTIHWVGIVRHNIFDPVTVDVPLYFFQTLLIIIVLKRKFVWLLLLAPIATLQKESFTALLLVILLVTLFEDYRNKNYRASIIVAVALILSIAARGIASHYFPPADPGKNAFIILLFHLKQTLANPFRLLRWLVAVFTAYGPLFILAIWTGLRSKSLWKGNRFLIFLSLTYLFLSHFAGGDMTRIAFLGFPFIMTWILLKLENTKGFMFKAAFIAGIPLLKVFGTMANPAVSGWDKFYNWFPGYANPVLIILWLAYMILCLVMFRIIEKKLATLP